MSDVRQFKISSGDEVVCEVVAWPEHEDDGAIVVRNVYQLVSNIADDVKYYGFRPWMVFQSGAQVFQSINVDHIIADATPSTTLLKYYHDTVANLAEEEGDDHSDEEAPLDAPADGNLVTFPGKPRIH